MVHLAFIPLGTWVRVTVREYLEAQFVGTSKLSLHDRRYSYHYVVMIFCTSFNIDNRNIKLMLLLFYLMCRLFIEKLPKHPEYGKAPASDKSRIKKLLKQALPRAMELKEKLKEKYEKEKLDLEKAIQSEVC